MFNFIKSKLTMILGSAAGIFLTLAISMWFLYVLEAKEVVRLEDRIVILESQAIEKDVLIETLRLDISQIEDTWDSVDEREGEVDREFLSLTEELERLRDRCKRPTQNTNEGVRDETNETDTNTSDDAADIANVYRVLERAHRLSTGSSITP